MELGTFKRDFKILVSKFSGTAQTALKTKSYLAGGALRSSYLQEKPKDYDIFFLNGSAMQDVLDEARDKGLVAHTSGSAITLKAAEGDVPFQLIRLDYGSPTEVVKRFDFTCNMNFYMPANDWGNIGYSTDIINRTLVFNPKASTPLSALIRVKKFENKGWRISEMQLARIGVAISKLNPITSGEQMKNLGMSEYSGPNVQSLDIGQVLSEELHPKRTSTRSMFDESLNFRNFVSYADIAPANAQSLSGVIQSVHNDVQRVERRRGATGRFVADANPFGGHVEETPSEVRAEVAHNQAQESRPEVAEQPVHSSDPLANRWRNTNTNHEATAPLTFSRLQSVVEQLRNAPIANENEEVPF